ncbi:MAG: glycosyltransferase family 2 protein, partial [Gemmatimonadales bacterium]
MIDRSLAIVIPCFNEEGTLRETHRRVSEAIAGIVSAFEIVYVDDGSSDRTPFLLHELQREDPRVRVVTLSRNFGHQSAVTAGLAHAEGDAVVIMDADLQDPPEVVGEMVHRWQEGYHVVYGVRTD